MLLCFMILNDISNFWFGGFPKFLSIIKTETGSLCLNGTRTIIFHQAYNYLSEGNL